MIRNHCLVFFFCVPEHIDGHVGCSANHHHMRKLQLLHLLWNTLQEAMRTGHQYNIGAQVHLGAETFTVPNFPVAGAIVGNHDLQKALDLSSFLRDVCL